MKMTVSINGKFQEESKIQRFATSSQRKRYEAVLLGRSGEKLKTFLLQKGDNELSFDEFAPGVYTLRIESGIEVLVKQIIIK